MEEVEEAKANREQGVGCRVGGGRLSGKGWKERVSLRQEMEEVEGTEAGMEERKEGLRKGWERRKGVR